MTHHDGEASAINKTIGLPHTRASLAQDFADLGFRNGQTVIWHSSLSSLGWVIGGANAVILAMRDVLGDEGTLMIPTHSSANSEPSHWQNPPVPETWWQLVRDHTPAFDPATTQTRQLGIIVELVRTLEGAQRSNHPAHSFAAVGRGARELVGGITALHDGMGESSPLRALYDRDGWVFLMGVGHGNCTALHLAEMRSGRATQTMMKQGAAVLVNGQREWVEYDSPMYDSDDFDALGEAFEQQYTNEVKQARIGQAVCRLVRVQPLIDFGVQWMQSRSTT